MKWQLMAGDENNDEWIVSKTEEFGRKNNQSTVWKDAVQREMPRKKLNLKGVIQICSGTTHGMQALCKTVFMRRL